MNRRIESGLTVVVALSAAAIAISVVYRGFIGRRPSQSSASSTAPPVYLAGWDSLLSTGVLIGQPSAPVTIAMFGDFECPACRMFHQVLRRVIQQHPGSIAVRFVHFPLPYHRFAMIAARASECAWEQGRFAAMFDLLYEKQDSLGLKSWISFALESGTPDTLRFDACISRTGPLRRVESGLAIGQSIAILGTPTVLINGWQYAEPPSEQEVTRAVTAILDGKSVDAR